MLILFEVGLLTKLIFTLHPKLKAARPGLRGYPDLGGRIFVLHKCQAWSRFEFKGFFFVRGTLPYRPSRLLIDSIYHRPPTMAKHDTPPAETCPIDPAARSAWLDKARQASQNLPPALPQASSKTPIPIPQPTRSTKTRALASDREVSTIPRADPNIPTTTPNPSSKPANNEQETGADVKSGNWIYPSEKMFFDAMKRKNYSPNATDMATIVPIHNAVNEKAWAEIKWWESRFGWAREENKACKGPRLHSFSGDSKKLSPRARWNSLLGYQEPFDRHDWVVERCPGQARVEYVIDFYSGKDEGKGKGLNFYLDVRPKLNSWEGWKMRTWNLIGLS